MWFLFVSVPGGRKAVDWEGAENAYIYIYIEREREREKERERKRKRGRKWGSEIEKFKKDESVMRENYLIRVIVFSREQDERT